MFSQRNIEAEIQAKKESAVSRVVIHDDDLDKTTVPTAYKPEKTTVTTLFGPRRQAAEPAAAASNTDGSIWHCNSNASNHC